MSFSMEEFGKADPCMAQFALDTMKYLMTLPKLQCSDCEIVQIFHDMEEFWSDNLVTILPGLAEMYWHVVRSPHWKSAVLSSTMLMSKSFVARSESLTERHVKCYLDAIVLILQNSSRAIYDKFWCDIMQRIGKRDTTCADFLFRVMEKRLLSSLPSKFGKELVAFVQHQDASYDEFMMKCWLRWISRLHPDVLKFLNKIVKSNIRDIRTAFTTIYDQVLVDKEHYKAVLESYTEIKVALSAQRYGIMNDFISAFSSPSMDRTTPARRPSSPSLSILKSQSFDSPANIGNVPRSFSMNLDMK